jgi:hypothetical protein
MLQRRSESFIAFSKSATAETGRTLIINSAKLGALSGSERVPKQTPANMLEEWKQCISLLDKFEDRLDGVRRYGFTFIAGLLSADALLGQVNGTVIPATVKVVVLLMAAFLILILRVLDRNYQLSQRAIGDRARKLEVELGMSLEKEYLDKYVKEKMWEYTLALYYGFEVVILLLGLAVTWGSVPLEVLAASGPIVAIAIISSIEPKKKKSAQPRLVPSTFEGPLPDA